MNAHQLFCNGEAQPVPFGRSGVIALIHPFKDMGEIRGRNSFPIIGNNDFCLLLRFGYSKGHLACGTMRQDILQQIIENISGKLVVAGWISVAVAVAIFVGAMILCAKVTQKRDN